MTALDDLIAAARDAATRAYAPYSRFRVGAAIRLTNGRVVTGANVENASYGLSLCAETVAIAKVANEGWLSDCVEIAIVGSGCDPVRPCGRCRQVLNEAAALGGRDLTVFCASIDGEVVQTYLLSTLLPHAFGPTDLGNAQPNTSTL